MVNRNAHRATVLALALVPMMAACTAAPSPSPSESSTPTPTVTTSTLSPAEQDLANARQAVVKLWEVVDRLTNDPRASIQDLDPVASGEVLTMFQKNLGTYRAQGWKGTGNTKVENPVANEAGTTAVGLTSWVVTACIDRSATTLVDAKGKSVQMAPYRIAHRSIVIQRSGGFEVDQDRATGTC